MRVSSKSAALVVLALSAASCTQVAPPGPVAAGPAMPRYDHIFVIWEENQGFADIMDKPYTPNITRLAKQYGIATQFYGIVHPSEGNYVAMLGGDTFGIHDDDAYYCTPGSVDAMCKSSRKPGYTNHTTTQPGLTDQLAAVGLSWRGYFESIPQNGSKLPVWPLPGNGAHQPEGLYASKHNGFMAFASVQNDPHRAERIVDFAALDSDLASGNLPNFAHIVPNQCNEMHGRKGADVPPDCTKENLPALIGRGDRVAGELVDRIMHSPVWAQPGKTAIVITFDESSHTTTPGDPQGCCGTEPGSVANFGGGHIPTVVITNHGPRGLMDPTPYSHYSLLRTIEDAFGITTHLGHAGDDAHGVVTMTKLFAVAS